MNTDSTQLPETSPVVEITRKPQKGGPTRTALTLRYPCWNSFLLDYTANVSIGAMYIQTPDPLNTGSLVEVNFVLPQALQNIPPKFTVSARVEWMIPPGDKNNLTAGMGIRLNATTPYIRESLGTLLLRMAS